MGKALTIALMSLVVVPSAFGHAEITPTKMLAGSVARLVVHVEGEASVPAVKIAVQLPSSLAQVTFEPVPGWKRMQNGRVVTWSGGRIEQGELGAFTLRARMPVAPGAEIVFPTVQTYANGKVVRWIGAESSETPAPRAVLTEAKQPNPPPPPVVTTVAAESDDGESHLTIFLVAAAVMLGLVALGMALVRRRRT